MIFEKKNRVIQKSTSRISKFMENTFFCKGRCSDPYHNQTYRRVIYFWQKIRSIRKLWKTVAYIGNWSPFCLDFYDCFFPPPSERSFQARPPPWCSGRDFLTYIDLVLLTLNHRLWVFNKCLLKCAINLSWVDLLIYLPVFNFSFLMSRFQTKSSQSSGMFICFACLEPSLF